MITNKYPYTDFHELNLDYVLKALADMGIKLDSFIEGGAEKLIAEYINKLLPEATYDPVHERIILKVVPKE